MYFNCINYNAHSYISYLKCTSVFPTGSAVLYLTGSSLLTPQLEVHFCLLNWKCTSVFPNGSAVIFLKTFIILFTFNNKQNLMLEMRKAHNFCNLKR